MKPGLSVGSVGQLAWHVDPTQTITLGFDTHATVFSTPSMINLMEHAARECLRPFLESHEESVGVTVQVQHMAATPVGAEVRADARVTAIDGRLIDFEVEAFDGQDQIGRGTHRRAVIAMDRFQQALASKSHLAGGQVMTELTLKPNPGELPALKRVTVDVEGEIAFVTLNRPEALNAVDIAMTDDLEAIVHWLAGHAEQIRVVILTGQGRAFCAGDDVKEVGTLTVQRATELSLQQARVYLAFERLPQPILAAVNGHAFGGGCVCAYSCDYRIAVRTAQFGMPEIKLGWAPGYGIAQLTALVGKSRAMQLCLTGEPITAQTACEWGLVNELVTPIRLMDRVRELADQLLSLPPRALSETKRLLHADEGNRPKLTYLADTAAYIRCLETQDAKEGITAFREKRPARFTGK